MARKPGPKPKIDAKTEAEIIACLTVGASLRDAAAYVAVDYMTLYRKRQNDPRFANRLIQAVAKGKLHHIRKIGKASQWQASAFMLERKWWKEFGRKDKVQQEHSGPEGEPIKTETTHVFDHDAYRAAFANYSATRTAAHSNGDAPASGNGHRQ